MKGLRKVSPIDQSPTAYKMAWNLLVSNPEWTGLACKRLLDGKYKFGDPKYVDFKNSRPLLVIEPRDRAVEQAILACIAPMLSRVLAFPNTFARKAVKYEDPRSLQHLASRIVAAREKKQFAFETDIKKFFPTIQNKILIQRLNEYLPDQTLNDLLVQIVQRQPKDMSLLKADYLWYFESIDRGVPQGSCLSPILAAVYLAPFDQAMTLKKYDYLRYVDDLVVFAETKEEAIEIECFVHEQLGHLKLDAHKSECPKDKKAHILERTEKLSFVGFDFMPSGKIQPRQKAIDRFHERVTEISDNSRTLLELLRKMANFTTGWLAAYSSCDIPISLRKKLDQHQMEAVRSWVDRNKVLARNYNNYPNHRQALALGIELLNKKTVPKEVKVNSDEFLDGLTLEDVE